MSLSIGSSSDAQSYLQSLLQLGAGSAGATAGAASFADPMLSAGQGSSSPNDPSATSGLLGASSSPFQSDTLSSLLSAQGQGAGAAGASGGCGDADGDADGSASSGSTTTQTTTNPDGSTTTTITYANGGTATTTTPAASDMQTGGGTAGNASGNSPNGGLLDQLGKLQSLLAPAVSTLMAVV